MWGLTALAMPVKVKLAGRTYEVKPSQMLTASLLAIKARCLHILTPLTQPRANSMVVSSRRSMLHTLVVTAYRTTVLHGLILRRYLTRNNDGTASTRRYYKLLYDVLRSYKRCTPKNICQLRNRQIFVFGTDKKGSQRQGAAWLAANRFGASVGVTDGLSGRAYALPTQGFSIEQLADAVRRFEEFARANPSFEFLVTPVGCGHAGFKIEEVAPLFQDCVGLMNVMLPEDFYTLLPHGVHSQLGTK